MKGIFDIKLYKEGLRITKNFGIIATVILTFISIVSVIGTISATIERAAYSTVAKIGESYVSYTNIFEINPLLLLVFVIVAPFMTMLVFNFTTNRAASDFYFSIPKRREKLYFSFLLSVVSWIVLMLLTSFMVPYLISIFFKKYIVINLLASLKYLLDFFLSSLLVISAVLIAISVTGNLFSNVFVALLIIFVPRIFIIVVTALGTLNANVVSDFSSIALLSPSINIPFGYVSSVFINKSDNLGVLPYIYTFILSTIYFCLGGHLFKKRQSEAATKSAATNTLSAVFRTVISAVVMLISTAMLLIMYFENDFSSTEIIAVIACFVLSFIAFCVYEIITTKSIKKCVKVLPQFAFPVIINVVAVIIALTVNSSILKFTPSTSDIKYVTLNRATADNNYITDTISNIKLDNFEVREIISESLKQNLKAYEKETYFFDTTSETGKYEFYNVKINTGIITRERMIYVENEKSERLVSALEASSEFKELFNTLPKPTEKTLTVDIYGNTISTQFSDSEKTAIYTALLEDIKQGNATGADIYNNITNGYYNNEFPFNISISMVKGINDYSLTIPINNQYTNCYALYIKKVNGVSADNSPKVLESMKTQKATTFLDGNYVDIIDYNILAAILEKAAVGIDDTYQHTFECLFEEYIDSSDEYIQYPCAFSVTEEQYQEIVKVSANYVD